MARLTRTTTTIPLDTLLQQRELLLRKMTSGIAEVEQPQLGRTQYRSMEEMQTALAYLDRMIDAAGGADADPAAAEARKRRPIYPVVREWC